MRVMITEDDKAIQLLLSKQIARWGFEVVTANDGLQAVQAVQSPERPDIIVMDWMMPRMSGVEACQAIKAMTDLPMTYILMLTSKHDRADVVTGLNAGADDFLCKPVDSAELHSRLKVAERTVDYERRLRRYATEMEQLARERAEQLVHADRLVTIGTLASSIAHEISSPLSAIMGNTQLMQQYWSLLTPHLPPVPADNREIRNILRDIPDMLKSLDISTGRIAELVNTIKRFYRKSDVAERALYSLNECVGNSLRVCWTKLKYEVNLEQEPADPAPYVLACPQQLDQVLINLLMNAYEAITVQGSGKGTIRISTGQENETAFIRVFDSGPTIPQEGLEKIWQAFYTTKATGSGLGLSISSGIVKAHGGSISAENCPEGGVAFTVSLPVDPAS